MTRVTADDFNEVPEPVEVAGMLPVRVVTFDDFISAEEPTADALLGTAEETLLPVGGMLLMYGDGGAGKTTLTVDAVVHLAAGVPWLGIEVERPVCSLMIENEGPRGKFRRKLDEKFASWNGHPPFTTRVHVLEEPWTRFSLREESHRLALAASVASLELDLVVMGPLVTLGMVGGGTPDEVAEFEELIRVTRALVERPFGFWVVHHENKAGDVSGAWERVPDCLVHVQAQGNGHTRLVWRKARWADESHGTSLDLLWAAGRSFTVRSEDSRDLHQEVRELYAASDEWRTAKEVAKAIHAREEPTKKALQALVQLEEIAYLVGPPGRGNRAQCYRLGSTAPALWEHPGAVGAVETTGGAGKATAPLRPLFKETVGSGAVGAAASGSESGLAETGAVGEDDTTTPAF